MAKLKPNLAGVLDGLDDRAKPVAETPPASVRRRRTPRPSPATAAEETVLVGANLPPSYARNLAILHAESGRTKKELLIEALDMLFVKKGGRNLERR